MSVPAIRRYNRAPISEAAFDFKTPPLAAEQLHLLRAVVDALREKYPQETQATEIMGAIADESISLTSSDGQHVARVRRDGFSLIRLAPYDSWESFTAELRDTWGVYSRIVAPPKLLGLSVHYINRLRVPIEMPLHLFFNIYPAMPDRDTLFTKMFMFTESPTTEPPGRVAVFMMPIIDPEEQSTGYFSMYLFNQFDFVIESERAVWESLDLIRSLKNATFESQLTDAMKETIS